ncbi:hypothetical protein MTR_6g072640 [Medicago truncatula]|uniref:Uncharacterized protein n=1 Tax=Medicago truncatula TaxID=3880 RepID=G7KIG9_MEDTR|nr:hypothetical protein MTR_6g072640 [Medicago truncatula]
MHWVLNIAHDPSASRCIFIRAIHACPWSKRLQWDKFVLTGKELSDLHKVTRDKELNMRTESPTFIRSICKSRDFYSQEINCSE